MRRADDSQLFSISLPPFFGNLHLFYSAQILTGNGFPAVDNVLHFSVKHHIAAVDARTRADVHNVVGSAHGFFVMFYDDDGVAQIAQPFQCGEQLVIVTLMQADARFVKDIKHAHQRRADLRRQADALALSAGKRAGGTRKREIFQPHAL